MSLLAGLLRQSRWWLLCLPLGFAPMVQASDAASGATSLAEARVWLTRIHNAAVAANYQGTLVFSSAGGVLSSSRVWHFFVGDQTYERLEALDGRQQHIVRHNDTVHTFWPQSRLAVLERRETLAAWSTTPQSIDPQALEHYELRREGLTRVAGREAMVLVLEPRDSLRYAQRLWADTASGLMLRADVLGLANGATRAVLESTAFSEVEIDVRPQPDLVLRAMQRFDGYRVLRPQQQRTTLEAEGWVLARPVAGFRHAGCVRRPMEGAGREVPVLQSVFSDGLTHVSLFVEHYRAEHHRNEMQAHQGATATLMQRRGEHWVTVVGDVPPGTLRLFADALERRR